MAKPTPTQPPINLPDRLGGVRADWLVTTTAATLVKHRARPKHVLAIVMTAAAPKRVAVLAIETTRADADAGVDALLARHSHDVVTRGAPIARALTMIDAYVAKWLKAKPQDPCGCETIKTTPARRGAKPADNSGCPREHAARRRRARQRRNARQLHASLSVN